MSSKDGQKGEQWASRLGVILAVAGSAVGLGNFLRFPGKAAMNGGGAFMIPYFVAFLFLALPLRAETVLSKYLSEVPADALVPGADGYGPVRADQPVAPVLKGEETVGWAFVTSDFVSTTGYSGKPIHTMVAVDADAKVIGVNIPEGRYVPAGSVVTTRAQADALPEITPSYAFATLNDGVLHVNEAFADAYLTLAEGGAGEGAAAGHAAEAPAGH